MNDITFAGAVSGAEEVKEHAHGDFEIVLFESGGDFIADGAKTAVAEGGVAVIPPLLKHRIACGNAVRAILDKALLPVRSALFIGADDAREIRHSVMRACLLFKENAAKNEGVLSAYGNLIAALIAAYAAPDGYSPAVQSVLDDLEKHIGDSTYSLESFIRSLPLNYDYVRKLFKKEVGVTPHEHLTRARMLRAKTILLSGVTNRYSNYSVTQIAEACGYAEPLYFSRVFKQYYGVAPSHYLKNL
ncbi:MAG: helix-turn-helix transcriptional regulator [Clostridia bacterium]|nr:helix-turn-helix transcriptional regulator [Clostridia bacterium]